MLDSLGINPWVRGEIYAATLPGNWEWAVLSGVEEVARLLEGLPVDVESAPEGSAFHAGDPVVTVAGRYRDFAVYETAFLGLLCQASGVATRAARCRLRAGDRMLYSFGARRMHPAVAPMIERSAFIGGCDGVAVVKSAELIGERAVGTMSHSLILSVGDEAEAYRGFDRAMDPQVRRVALIDTFQDEKFGALTAAEALGEKLAAVRLDTPRSRRGNFLQIIKETRWELDMRGYDKVGIFVSGGLDEEEVDRLRPYVQGYGVGTAISNAPVVDFSFDLIEVGVEPRAKRGKMSGNKILWRCPRCLTTLITASGEKAPPSPPVHFGVPMESLRKEIVRQGKVEELPPPQDIRRYCLEQLSLLEAGEPHEEPSRRPSHD